MCQKLSSDTPVREQGAAAPLLGEGWSIACRNGREALSWGIEERDDRGRIKKDGLNARACLSLSSVCVCFTITKLRQAINNFSTKKKTQKIKK